MKNILYAASEAVPFMKTGGLADVVGALPKYFPKEYFDVRVILPKYTAIKEMYSRQMKFRGSFYMDLNWRKQYVGVFEMKLGGVTFYFIDNEEHFGGNEPYSGIPWDLEKFAFFCKALLSALPGIGFRPDIIHCHDWQTGLVPVYLKERFQNDTFYHGIRTIMTIHNLKFQGIWDIKTVKQITGLSEYYFTPDKLEFKKDANYLKGGIVFADMVTTVSKTYADEVKTPFYGEGLDGLLRARQNRLQGIVNGIDYDIYNPETDSCIYKNYTPKNFRKEKAKNKVELQRQLHLEENPAKMMIGIVSRLTAQKGLDLIAYMMEELCGDNIQLVVLGTGDPKYENMFRHYAWKYGDRVSANIYYSEEMSHKIYAAADAFLMPSLFEPCGLSQLISLRYGTVPIVRQTGGLVDTVEPYNEYESTGTGFCFANYNAHEMLGIVRYAERIYYDRKREWNKMIDRAMARDFSWSTSAHAYQDLYDWLAG